MDEETVRALNAINRRFYEVRAEEFDQTRERPWRGWVSLCDRVGDLIPRDPAVLDVGCGNGRFARFLAGRGASFNYYGIDASPLALEHARQKLAPLDNVYLSQHDSVLSSQPLPPPLASRRFDVIVLFGVLHHVPGRERRARLLASLAERLAAKGVLAYTVWRFDRFPRFVKKLVPWDDYLELSSTKLELTELEPGDHIMTWGSPPAYRYCHAASDEEMDALAGAVPLEPSSNFLGDDDLNRYWVFQRAGC